MPNVTIRWYRNAGDSNYLYGMPGGTIGPDGGSRTVNITGGSYSLSANGSGPGSVAIRALNSTTLGLDDRQGAGADNDFNDMLIYVSAGRFSGSTYYGPTPVFGCTDPQATNYNPNADNDDGSCVYPLPVPTLNANPTSYIRGGSTVLTWSTTNSQYATSIRLTGGGLNENVAATNTTGLTVSPVTTTTYTLTTTYSFDGGGSLTDSETITVYQPPVVTLYADTNPIPLGATTVLRWSTTGDADRLNISPGIGSSNLTSNSPISPTVTTTYTATASGLGGVSSTEYTMVVWQPPEVSINGPTSIDFGEDLILIIDAVRATTSLILQRSIDNGATYQTIATFTPAASHANLQYDATPPWDEFTQGIGIYEFPQFRLTGIGEGNLQRTDTFELPIYIDRLPDQINIPESGDKLFAEEPVISPDSEIVSEQIVIRDIDVPVTIKADYPIQVEIDNDAVWRDVEQL